MPNTDNALSRETIDDTFRLLGLLDAEVRERVAALGRVSEERRADTYKFSIADNTWAVDQKQEECDA